MNTETRNPSLVNRINTESDFILRDEPIDVLWERVKAQSRKNTIKLLAERMQAKFYRRFSETNLGDLIRGTAKSDSPETKNQIRVVLREWLAESESVSDGRTESEVSPVEIKDLGDEYHTAAEWKQIALQLQEENNRLRGAIQLLAAPGTPFSSAAIAKAEQLALEILRRSKQGSQPGDAGSSSKAA